MSSVSIHPQDWADLYKIQDMLVALGQQGVISRHHWGTDHSSSGLPYFLVDSDVAPKVLEALYPVSPGPEPVESAATVEAESPGRKARKK